MKLDLQTVKTNYLFAHTFALFFFTQSWPIFATGKKICQHPTTTAPILLLLQKIFLAKKLSSPVFIRFYLIFIFIFLTPRGGGAIWRSTSERGAVWSLLTTLGSNFKLPYCETSLTRTDLEKETKLFQNLPNIERYLRHFLIDLNLFSKR
jgi:hypothetical protein